jgi:triosephosphate isomerase
MRTPLIAGNWKMNKTEAEAITLVRVLMQRLGIFSGVEVLVFPPFTSLSQLHKLLVSSPIKLGAQNISQHPGGAYTGEISAKMAAEFCSHVILGHSERRSYYGETDEVVNEKVKAAQAEGLIPIVCVGEELAERERGAAASVINRQLQGSLAGVFPDLAHQLVVAYEPVWAIGSGLTASPQETSDLIARVIRPTLAGMWGGTTAAEIRVLYGGSVNAGNAGGFFIQPEIDGALVGGASLSPEDFLAIISKTS